MLTCESRFCWFSWEGQGHPQSTFWLCPPKATKAGTSFRPADGGNFVWQVGTTESREIRLNPVFDTTIRKDKFPRLFFLAKNWGFWRIGDGRNFFFTFLEGMMFLAKAITKRELQEYLPTQNIFEVNYSTTEIWFTYKLAAAGCFSNLALLFGTKNEQVTLASGCIYIERRVGG